YGAERRNSRGLDLSVAAERARVVEAVAALLPVEASPIVGGAPSAAPDREVRDPSDPARRIGVWREAGEAEIEAAFAQARAAQPAWDALGGVARAAILRAMADALERERHRFIALAVREAGKTLSDAVAEVREAADFLRYYARLAETRFAGP